MGGWRVSAILARRRCLSAVSQPTLSVALKSRRADRCALFERGSNDIRITPLGERIVEQARRVLAGRSVEKSPRRLAIR